MERHVVSHRIPNRGRLAIRRLAKRCLAVAKCECASTCVSCMSLSIPQLMSRLQPETPNVHFACRSGIPQTSRVSLRLEVPSKTRGTWRRRIASAASLERGFEPRSRWNEQETSRRPYWISIRKGRPAMQDSCLLLTIPEAAARLGVSRSTMYRLIRSGDIEILTVRTRQRVRPSALERYVDRQQRLHREMVAGLS